MGYRSDVAITMLKNDYIEMIKKAKDENTIAYKLLTNTNAKYKYNINESNQEIITIHYKWIKWYSDEVDWIENYLTENKIEHLFLRTGEDITDNEYRDNTKTSDMCLYSEIRTSIHTTGEDIDLEDILCNLETTNKKMQTS